MRSKIWSYLLFLFVLVGVVLYFVLFFRSSFCHNRFYANWTLERRLYMASYDWKITFSDNAAEMGRAFTLKGTGKQKRQPRSFDHFYTLHDLVLVQEISVKIAAPILILDIGPTSAKKKNIGLYWTSTAPIKSCPFFTNWWLWFTPNPAGVTWQIPYYYVADYYSLSEKNIGLISLSADILGWSIGIISEVKV